MSNKNKKKPILEKIEETLDATLYKTQNALYGKHNNLLEDIPATMEDPSGFRKINKFATRRNLSLRLIKNLKFILIALVIVATIVIIAIV